MQHSPINKVGLNSLIAKATSIYSEHFPPTTNFERAIFFSWYCSIRDCTFCFMSVNPERYTRLAVRHPASILAEVLLTKHLGWDFGFFSGGVNAYTAKTFLPLLKKVVHVYGGPIWLNIGPLSKQMLEQYVPHIAGVVGSIETINPKLHKSICPSKPIEPYARMFDAAGEFGLKKAMTIIVGLGETHDDFPLLADFIKKHNIDKLHLYGLVPQKGTLFQSTPPPSPGEQAWWIAQTRINFPTLDIQAGIWKDRINSIPLLLAAGANSFSKFPALRLFGTKTAHQIEHQAALAHRPLTGTLTHLPDANWNEEISSLDLEPELKAKIKSCLWKYLAKMENNIKAPPQIALS